MKFDYDKPPTYPGDCTNVAAWLRAHNFPYEIEEATLWRVWYGGPPDEDLMKDEDYACSVTIAPYELFHHDGMSQVVVRATIDPDLSENPKGYNVMERKLHAWADQFKQPDSTDSELFGIIEARPGDEDEDCEPNEALIFLDVLYRPLPSAVRFFKKLPAHED